MHNRSRMRLIRVSFAAAAVLAGGAAMAADAPSTVGDPALRLSTSLARVPPEPLEPAPATAGPSFTERTRQPVEVLRQANERSEHELLEALAKAKQQQASTAEIERRLAQVRAQRYANPVVYTLAALLAAAAVGAAFFWRRLRSIGRPSRAMDEGAPAA